MTKKNRRRRDKKRKRKRKSSDSSLPEGPGTTTTATACQLGSATTTSSSPSNKRPRLDDETSDRRHAQSVSSSCVPPPLPPDCLKCTETSDPNVGLDLARRVLLRLARKKKKKTKMRRKQSKKNEMDADDDELQPTPVQLRTWPILLPRISGDGEEETEWPNLICVAPTGSGKTLAYGVPMIERCRRRTKSAVVSPSSCGKRGKPILGLVLVPTRELALQVSKELGRVVKCANDININGGDDERNKGERDNKLDGCSNNNKLKLEVLAVYGGVDRTQQLDAIYGEDNNDNDNDDVGGHGGDGDRAMVLAATPGRLLDLMGLGGGGNNSNSSSDEKKTADVEEEGGSALLRDVCFVVIDEADRMASSGEMCGQVDSILGAVRGNVNDDDVESTAMRGGKVLGDNSDCITCLFSATLPERVTDKVDDWVGKRRVMVRVDAFSVGGGAGRAEEGGGAPTAACSTNAASSSKDVDGGDAIEGVASESLKRGDNGTTSSFQSQNSKGDDDDDKAAITSGDEERSLKAGRAKERSGPLDLARIPSNIEQIVHVCSNHKKPAKLLKMLAKIRADENSGESGGGDQRRRQRGLCLVFFGRIKTLRYIGGLLRKEDDKCVELHGQIDQKRREKTLNDFRSGKCPTMLATDVAARGIHVNNVRYVINYDFPGALEQYIHRCGRAGRNKGKASVYSYFTREMAPMAKDLVALLESTNAWVDPNLRALVNAGDDAKEPKAKQKRRRGDKRKDREETSSPEPTCTQSPPAAPSAHSDVDASDSDGWDDGQFANLVANKIVLKRASHVSDAEESSDDQASKP